MKPAFEHILVEEIKQKTQSVIISTAKISNDDPRYGVIKDLGVGKMNKNKQIIPPSVNVGETVIFTVGQELKMDGKTYVIVRECDILGVVED